ncbi:hypothetical protein [Nocardia jejuensis]|nr:hypothetical protein [Nocardia jejuensis]
MTVEKFSDTAVDNSTVYNFAADFAYDSASPTRLGKSNYSGGTVR